MKKYILVIISLLLILFLFGCAEKAAMVSPQMTEATSTANQTETLTPTVTPTFVPSPSASSTPSPSQTPEATLSPKDQLIADSLARTGQFSRKNYEPGMAVLFSGPTAIDASIGELGLINNDGAIEGVLVDYQENADYLVLTMSFDDKDGNPFDTYLAIPKYFYKIKGTTFAIIDSYVKVDKSTKRFLESIPVINENRFCVKEKPQL